MANENIKYGHHWIKTVAVPQKLEFDYFWGGVYSQWADTPFKYGDIEYPTAEHWMMMAKADLFGDKMALKRMTQTPDPKQVKALGRKVQNFNDEIWDKAKIHIVIAGSILKFHQNPAILQYLLNSQVIVEASPYDTIWGIGLQGTPHPDLWKGDNLLGRCLMIARDIIIHQPGFIEEYCANESENSSSRIWKIINELYYNINYIEYIYEQTELTSDTVEAVTA